MRFHPPLWLRHSHQVPVRGSSRALPWAIGGAIGIVSFAEYFSVPLPHRAIKTGSQCVSSQSDDARARLQEISKLIKDHRAVIKPFFGLVFWECLDLGDKVNPEQLSEQGMQMTMHGDHDEIIAEFLTSFVEIWRSSKDLTASSRFVAQALDMSAAELLETRSLYLRGRS